MWLFGWGLVMGDWGVGVCEMGFRGGVLGWDWFDG